MTGRLAGRGWLVVRLAWRLARGQRRRLLLVVACIAIGVAARVAVATAAHAIAQGVTREARSLLGGDLEVASNGPLEQAQRDDLTAVLPAGARMSDETILLTMARGVASNRGHGVEIHAVPPEHPLCGHTRIRDAQGHLHGTEFLTAPVSGVALPQDGMVLLGVHPGDEVIIGQLTLPVVGELLEDPGLGASLFVPGPRVLMPASLLNATGLVGVGARLRHALIIALPDPRKASVIARELRRIWKLPGPGGMGFAGRVESPTGIQVRTASESQESLSRFFTILGDFLALTSTGALVLGAVGVVAVIRAAVSERLEQLAVLQVLGASTAVVQGAIALQALSVGVIGGVVGAAGGMLVDLVLVRGLRHIVPVPVHATIDWPVVLGGIALGALTAAYCAWLPVWEMARLRPLPILRGELPPTTSRLQALVVALAGGAAAAVLASWDAHEVRIGLEVIGGLVIAVAVLSTLATGLLRLAARLPTRSFASRHGLSNLARPGFRPLGAAVAVAGATLLLGASLVQQASIQAELSGASAQERASLFCIDLQADDRDDFTSLVRQTAGIDPMLAPLVVGRLRGVVTPSGAPAPHGWGDGKPVKNREVRLSTRATLSSDEHLVAGRWLKDDPAHPEASLEQGYANGIGAHLHDHLHLEVQGVPIDAEVTSLRTVRWQTLRPNFFILLSPSALADAPTTYVAAIPAIRSDQQARLQTEIATRFPEVSVLDVADIAARVGQMLARIGKAVRYLGLATLAAGLVVLGSIAVATARERRQDAALVRVLGGGTRTILATIAWEFAGLGAIGACCGLIGSIALGWQQAHALLNLAVEVPWVQLVVLGAAIALITAVAGVLACRRVVSTPPLAVLREG